MTAYWFQKRTCCFRYTLVYVSWTFNTYFEMALAALAPEPATVSFLATPSCVIPFFFVNGPSVTEGPVVDGITYVPATTAAGTMPDLPVIETFGVVFERDNRGELEPSGLFLVSSPAFFKSDSNNDDNALALGCTLCFALLLLRV